MGLPRGTRVYLAVEWLDTPAGNPEWFARSATNLEAILVREMAHVVQRPPRHQVAHFWVEGVADFVR